MATLTQPADPTARILGPDGRPWHADAPEGIKLPQVWTFGSLVNTFSKSYSWKWDEAYSQSQETALAMRLDCNLMGLLRERQLPTEQMRWHIEPEDKNDATQVDECAFLEKVIQRTPYFNNYKRACLEAIWYGRAGPQQALTKTQIDGEDAVYISNHVPINGDKIQFSWDGTPEIRLYMGAMTQVEQAGGTVVIGDVGSVMKLDKPFWRSRFVIHRHDVVDADFMDVFKAGGVNGVGVRSWIYWLNWMKLEVMSWLMDFMERTGLGLTIYFYDAANPNGEQAARDAAKKDGRNTVIVYPRNADGTDIGAGIERIETQTAGAEVIIEMVERMFDNKIERFIIGQTMSSRQEGGGLGGSHAAKFQANTKYRLIKSDCDNLAETLTVQLVDVLKKLNPKTQNSPYYYRWVFNVDEFDPEAKLNAAKVFFDMGGTLDMDEVREPTGFSKPKDEDNLLQQLDPMEMMEAEARLNPKPGANGKPANGKPKPSGKGKRQDHSRNGFHSYEEEGHWVTMNGQHVFIKGGKIQKPHPWEASHEKHAPLWQRRDFWDQEARRNEVKPSALRSLVDQMKPPAGEYEEKDYASMMEWLHKEALNQLKSKNSVHHNRLDLQFYEDLQREQKSFLTKVLDTVKAGEKRIERTVKTFFGRVASKVRRIVDAAFGRVSPPPAIPPGTKPAEPWVKPVTMPIPATEEDIKAIAETVAEAIDVPELKEELKPTLERLHTAGALLELDDNVQTRIGAYSGDDVWRTKFSTLRKKLPDELKSGAAEFLETTFQQPWWDSLPGEVGQELAQTLRKGLYEGESIEGLIARFQNTFADLSSKRARLIARTESTGALNAGLQAARVEQYRKGLVKGKAWHNLDHEKVRKTHREADEQEVGVLDDFIVGGERCQYPGDQRLSAKERANCRCVARSVPVESPEPQSYARNDAGGHWVTIGGEKGEDGKHHGGSPVFIKGDRIEKGAPDLKGKTLPELKKHPQHDHWTGKAKEAGVGARGLHQLAHEMHEHDKSFAEHKTKMLQEARALSKKLGYDSLQGLQARGARGRLDADKIKGLDDVAERMMEQYPELLGSDRLSVQEKLFDLLVAGNVKPMSRDDAYEQALEHLVDRKRAKRSREHLEPAPFQRTPFPELYAGGRWVTIHGTHVFIEGGKVVEPPHLKGLERHEAHKAIADKLKSERGKLNDWMDHTKDAPAGTQRSFLPGDYGDMPGTQGNLFDRTPQQKIERPRSMPGQTSFLD